MFLCVWRAKNIEKKKTFVWLYGLVCTICYLFKCAKYIFGGLAINAT